MTARFRPRPTPMGQPKRAGLRIPIADEIRRLKDEGTDFDTDNTPAITRLIELRNSGHDYIDGDGNPLP